MNENTDKLFKELAQIIERGKKKVTSQVNNTMTMVYWYVGKRINEEVIKNERAEYGKQIVTTVSTQLVMQYGKGFTEKNVRRMMQFAEQFKDIQIVVTVSRQLSWSHFVNLLPLKTMEANYFI